MQGPLTFSSPPGSSGRVNADLPSGQVVAVLSEPFLLLYQPGPLKQTRRQVITVGAGDVTRIDLRDWSCVRRRADLDDALGFALELCKESGSGRAPNLGRKRSQSALGETTNSFGGRLAAKMKRGKSILSAAAVQPPEPPGNVGAIASLMAYAPSAQLAENWIATMSAALCSVPPGLPTNGASRAPPPRHSSMSPSASLPVDLSRLALSDTAIASSGVQSRRMPVSNAVSSRRPSWLDRPAPSPSTYLDGAISPVGDSNPQENPSTVIEPGWFAAARAGRRKSFTPTPTPRLADTSVTMPTSVLKSRRSASTLAVNVQSSLPSPVASSIAMSRSQSDGRASIDAGGRRLFSLIGRRGSKKSHDMQETLHHDPFDEALTRALLPQSTGSARMSRSVTCAADLGSRSTSSSAEFPSASPHPARLQLAEVQARQRANSPKSSESAGLSGSRSGRQAMNFGHADEPSADDAAFDAADIAESGLSTLPGRRTGSKHIIQPSVLIEQMRVEASQRHGGLRAYKAMSKSVPCHKIVLGGLSPPPKTLSTPKEDRLS